MVIQWLRSQGQTPKTVTLPYAQLPLSVVGITNDHNDGWVDSVACYNFTDTGFSYIIGNNVGNYASELVYFLAV